MEALGLELTARCLRALPLPAAEAGLQTGDTVTAIDGRPTSTWRLADLWRVLRGEEGTVVRFEVRRAGAPMPVQLTLRRLIRSVAGPVNLPLSPIRRVQ